MRNWFVGAFLTASWMAAAGVGDARAQTFVFSANSPAWGAAPMRGVNAKVEWALLAGQTATNVKIEVFKVTFPGGVRTETSIGMGSNPAPPAITSPWVYAQSIITGAGTYCVKGTLYYTSGGVAQTPIPIQSADQAL
jgi:hypothetical protein